MPLTLYCSSFFISCGTKPGSYLLCEDFLPTFIVLSGGFLEHKLSLRLAGSIRCPMYSLSYVLLLSLLTFVELCQKAGAYSSLGLVQKTGLVTLEVGKMHTFLAIKEFTFR